MKTTVDIADAILLKAKELAARRGVTLREVIESALRDALATAENPHRKRKLRRHTFGGNGLQPGVDPSRWREVSHQGRGG